MPVGGSDSRTLDQSDDVRRPVRRKFASDLRLTCVFSSTTFGVRPGVAADLLSSGSVELILEEGGFLKGGLLPVEMQRREPHLPAVPVPLRRRAGAEGGPSLRSRMAGTTQGVLVMKL